MRGEVDVSKEILLFAVGYFTIGHARPNFHPIVIDDAVCAVRSLQALRSL
jgi:hypothetical protein